MRINAGRLTGVFMFGLFAFWVGADLISSINAFSSLNDFATTFGMTSAAATARLIIQTLLSVGIIITALLTAYGLYARARWSIKPARIMAVMFVIYGAFLVIASFSFVTQNQTAVSTSGALYVLIGVAVISLLRRATAPRPPES